MQYNDERLRMTIENLREEIDQIDEDLLNLIGKRLEVVKQIGELKKESGKPIIDAKREEEKITSLTNINTNGLLTKEHISKIWKTLFEVAYTVEK